VTFFFLVAIFFTTASLVAAHYIWAVPERQAARALGRRMRELRAQARGRTRSSPELLRREHRGSFAFLGDLVAWVGLLRRLQELIEQANLRYRAADVFIVSLLAAAATFAVLSISGAGNWMTGLVLAVLAGLAPLVYILRVRRRRLRKFERQLPDAIDLFTRSMRAGHNLHSGLETVAAETADPLRMEFRKMMEELALGSQVEPALHALGKRVPLIDLKFFITALILQRQTGANMVAVLENLATLVRERLDMAEKLKAHTAQQRLSAWLLCGLPLVVGLGFYIQKPEYERMLWTDPTGSKFLTAGIVLEIVGILIIRRIAKVRV